MPQRRNAGLPSVTQGYSVDILRDTFGLFKGKNLSISTRSPQVKQEESDELMPVTLHEINKQHAE